MEPDDKTETRERPEYLTTKSFLRADEDFRDSDEPHVDIVHVSAIYPEEELHDFTNLITSEAADRRELVFRFEVAALLAGSLTPGSLKQQAIRLLSGLVTLRKQDTTKIQEKRAIIFAAYDLGALVVKKAISLAAKSEEEYPGIFTNTAQIVFTGCPQRGLELGILESKLFEFLSVKKDDEWSHLLNATSIRFLAASVLQTTQMFINSKITLRSRIISLYANQEKPGKFHPAFDYFTATLGVPPEVLIQEHQGDGSVARFPSLRQYLSHNSENWVPHLTWVPMEKALLSRSSPHRQFQSTSPAFASHPVLENPTYKEWAEFAGSQILHIYGSSYRAAHNVAEQIFLAWQAEAPQDWDDNYAKALCFSFDSTDPLRDNISDMLASVLVQVLGGHATGSVNGEYDILQDRFLFNGGWTEKSCLNTLEPIMFYHSGPYALLLLHDLDECDKDSRGVFLNYYKELSERSERPFRILATSREPTALLLEELRDWPSINVDDVALPAADNDIDDEGRAADPVVDLCPLEEVKDQIRRALARLAPMSKTGLQRSLGLLQEQTGWPKDRSVESLTKFTHLLEQIQPRDTPGIVLDRILRSHSDLEEVRWALSWLLCSYRPLSQRELTTILAHYRPEKMHGTCTHPPPDLVSPAAEEQILHRLMSWARVLFESSESHVTIRMDIRDLLEEDTVDGNEYIWNEVRRTAHQSLARFCLELLSTDAAQRLLDSVWRQYGSTSGADEQQQQAQRQITAPIVPDVEHTVFYAVQAFPYHLSKCQEDDMANDLRSLLEDPTIIQPFSLWAKNYWAMSNPFSRSLKAPPVSPLPVLVGLGMISYDDIKKAPDMEGSRAQCLVAAAGSRRHETLTKLLQEDGGYTISVLADVLAAAIQVADETMALEIAKAVLALAGSPDDSPLSSLQSALWAATWLNMGELAGFLLNNGAKPEPKAARAFPSPLYMASRFGHAAVVRTLLAHGARTDIKKNSRVTALEAAANYGHVNVLRSYIENDPSLSEPGQLGHWLIGAAGLGSIKAAEFCISLGADQDREKIATSGGEWGALEAASSQNFPRTIKALLESGANPNRLGPYDVDTPLWFAVIGGTNLQCVRHMIDHGGDPNHERIRPPLILELANSGKDTKNIVDMCDALIGGDSPIKLDARASDGDTALMIASRKGNIPFLKWLLNHGADVNALDNDGQSALYFAVKDGNVALVEELLERKPKLDILHRWSGMNLLQVALPKPAIVKLLLDAGANPEFASKSGNTLVNSAILGTNLEVVRLLADRKADIHHPDSSGRTPIYAAVSHVRDAALVRLLTDRNVNLREMDSEGRNLHHVALDGPPEIVKNLLEFRKSVDPDHRDNKGRTPLLAATETANIDSLKLLIKAGADINAQDSEGETALHHAVRSDNVPFVSALLAEPDIMVDLTSPRCGTPLHVACQQASVDSVPVLLDRDANINAAIPNNVRSTPLMAALLPGNQVNRSRDSGKVDQIVRTLVRRGGTVNLTVPGSVLYSPIMAACLGAGVSTINSLLDEGASSQLVDPISGRIPLHLAAANGIENFQAALLPYRGDMMIADNRGKNCLHWAAQFGNAKTIEFILSRLGDQAAAKRAQCVGLADSDGWTPLCWATRPCEGSLAEGMRSEKRDHVGVIRILLSHGANPAVSFQYGIEGDDKAVVTPLVLAQRCGAGDEVVNMLKSSVEEKLASGVGDQSANCDDIPARKYSRWSIICGICLGPIFGLVHKCTSCAAYHVCAKCLDTVTCFHNSKTKDDGHPHTFELDQDRAEYADTRRSSPEARRDGAGETVGGKEGQGGDGGSNNGPGFGRGAIYAEEDIEIDTDEEDG